MWSHSMKILKAMGLDECTLGKTLESQGPTSGQEEDEETEMRLRGSSLLGWRKIKGL